MSCGLIHFVGYSLVEGVPATKTERVRAGFERLVAAIDGAELVSIGPNVSASALAREWHYAVAVRLPDRAALAAYLAHPEHAALGAETRDGFYDQCAVFDIETGPRPAGGDLS